MGPQGLCAWRTKAAATAARTASHRSCCQSLRLERPPPKSFWKGGMVPGSHHSCHHQNRLFCPGHLPLRLRSKPMSSYLPSHRPKQPSLCSRGRPFLHITSAALPDRASPSYIPIKDCAIANIARYESFKRLQKLHFRNCLGGHSSGKGPCMSVYLHEEDLPQGVLAQGSCGRRHRNNGPDHTPRDRLCLLQISDGRGDEHLGASFGLPTATMRRPICALY